MEKRFSERIGITSPPTSIQVDSMNDELRNSLWNLVYTRFEVFDGHYWPSLARRMAQSFLKTPIDSLPAGLYSGIWVRDFFYSCKWYEVYNLVEFVVENDQDIFTEARISNDDLTEAYNFILESELLGFRFVSGVLVPISNSYEVGAIAQAIDVSQTVGLSGTHKHLKTAIEMLGKKPEADYRNAIKEAISAVESISKQLGSSDSQGLAGALSELEKHFPMHGALKQGFIKLYGYTSDESGIRHAILNEPTVGLDEAKYMIVSCSAFVNYLIGKASNYGLLTP